MDRETGLPSNTSIYNPFCSNFVIDTVKFLRRYELKLPIAPQWQGDWKLRTARITNLGKSFTLHKFLHRPTDLRAEFSGRNVYVEVSLPRLLFPHNGKLITSQEQIDAAMRKAGALVAQIATRQTSTPATKFVHVDLAWQIKGQIQDFIAAHQHNTHPEIHASPRIWYGESIAWEGKEMRITFYDKFAELRKKQRTRSLISRKSRDIVRIEVQLDGSKLKSLLGNKRDVTRLDAADCYKVLRQRICALSPATLFRVTNILQIYKHAIIGRWTIGTQPAIDVFLASYSNASRAKIQKKLLTTRLSSYKIDWNGELPPQMPSGLMVKNGCSYSMPGFP